MIRTTYSDIKIFKHTDKLNDIKNNLMPSPISIRLKPTNRCNCNCFYCVSADTNILMSDFTHKKISEIKISDEVIGFDELIPRDNSKFRKIYTTKVTNIFKRKANTIKITLDDGKSLVVTPNHRILTNRDHKQTSWREAGRFKIGQEIRINPYLPVNCCDINDRNYKIGYIIGMIMGDGTFGKEFKIKNGKVLKNSYKFRLALQDNEPINVIKKYFDELNIYYTLRGFDIYNTKNKEKYEPALYCERKNDYNKLKSLIIENTVLNDTYEYACGFLAGIYDAEGHIDKSSRTIRISNTDINIIKEIERTLDTINIPYIKEFTKKNNIKQSDIHIIRIKSPLNKFNHLKFIQLTQPKIKRKGIENFYNTIMSNTKQIIKIEKWNTTDVYNIETESHTYIANNICIHNCTYINPEDSMRDIDSEYTFDKSDEIPEKTMKMIISNIIEMGVKSVTFSGGGEPLLYPNIEKIIQPLYDNNVDVGFITNGLELRGKKAEVLAKSKWVRISLDCHTPSLYSKMREVSEDMFNMLCNNIKNFIAIKDDSCEVGVNYVINHMNHDQVYDSAMFIRESGLSHVKFYPRVTRLTDNYHDDYMKQVIDDIKRAEDELQTDTFKIINQYESGLKKCSENYRTYSMCPIMHISPVIAGDSKLYVCHDKAYTTDGMIGDLKKTTLKELWFSEHTKNIFKNFNVKESCKYHCAYDQRNLIINEYLNLNEDNVNFI